MKNRKLFMMLILSLVAASVYGQVPINDELIGIHVVTEAAMNGIANPVEGTLVYNSDKKSIHQYNGTVWKSVTSISKLVDNSNGTYTFTNNDGVAITFNPGGIQTISSSDNTVTTTLTGNTYDLIVPKINKSYVQFYNGTRVFGSASATLLNLFPEVTIQAGKKVELTMQVPTRSDSGNWGGLYININAKVNGTWYNLGNGGYDGAAMVYGGTPILTYSKVMLLDFITNLGLPADQDYTLQFELTAKSWENNTTVNGSHDINRTANGLNVRGALQAWASNQHFTHLIIREMDR